MQGLWSIVSGLALIALVAVGAACDSNPQEQSEASGVAKSNYGRKPSGDQRVGRFEKTVLYADAWHDDQAIDSLAYPTEFEVAADGGIFFTELGGALKRLPPEGGAAATVLTLDVWSAVRVPPERTEEGLLGIALDPAFADNGFLYVYYGHPVTEGEPGQRRGKARVSRFRFGGEQIDPASEKVLLEWSIDRDDCCHAGGGVEFDAAGNLYIGTGDNTRPAAGAGYACLDDRPESVQADSQRTAANSNDLRGKILRIHPEPDGTYTIPSGNLFTEGLADTRPEIYVMGTRNAFRLGIDRRKGILYWGDPGPDAGSGDVGDAVKGTIRGLLRGSRGPKGYDEINQARTAGNYGWPYFVGNNLPYARYDSARERAGELFDPENVRNDSRNNTGLVDLPDARPPLIAYPYDFSEAYPEVGAGGRVAAAGPVYYFDERIASACKLPREYDHALFIYDWMRSFIIAVHLDADERVERLERIAPGIDLRRPIDLEIGPDGCLYVAEWGTSWGNANYDSQLVRIDVVADAGSDAGSKDGK